MPEPLNLDPAACRERQRRIAAFMERLDLAHTVLTRPEHVQYATGFRPMRVHRALVVVARDGTCLLVAPNVVLENAAADDVRTFEPHFLCTLRQDQWHAVAEVLRDARGKGRGGRVGLEFTACPPCIRDACGEVAAFVDVEPELWGLRRKKDPDELRMMRRAIDCTHAMYERAREILEPGLTELQVFSELHAAAVRTAGEPPLILGNDYRANSPGGPPRDRAIEAGELIVLDLGPTYRGYFADNCRTFAVGAEPTDEQLRAWEAVTGVLRFVEETVKPGVSCPELFERAKAMLAEGPGEFFHHLGHGVGLFPHETPHLNSHWDDVFEEGDVFTAEPGLYAPELRAGMRIEQNYRVTADGVERLTSFPVEL